jgi:hypothetical protein
MALRERFIQNREAETRRSGVFVSGPRAAPDVAMNRERRRMRARSTEKSIHFAGVVFDRDLGLTAT